MTRAHHAGATPVAPLDGAPGGPTAEQVTAIADTLQRLNRAMERKRQHFLAAAQHDVEWSAHMLINTVAACGPARASALAERLHSDPSTVSRQVAALVKDGVLERQADPEDGRASLLVVTEKGRAIHEEQLLLRTRIFARMLEGWSERDARRFASLLDRFTAQYETAFTTIWAEADAERRATTSREES